MSNDYLDEGIIEVKVVPEKLVYEQNGYQVYGCGLVGINNEVTLNQYGNLSVTGHNINLEINKEMVLLVSEFIHPVHGKTYKYCGQQIENTPEAQYKFLKTVLTENQYNTIYQAYPEDGHIIENLLSGNIDLNRLKGIKQAALANIQSKIESSIGLHLYLTSLQELNLTQSMIQRIIDHFESPQQASEAIREDIYILCDVAGLGFITVDKYALKTGIERNSEYRLLACLHYCVREQEKDGHCWTFMAELVESMEVALNGNNKSFNEDEIVSQEFIWEFLKSDTVQENNLYYTDSNRLGFSYNFEREAFIALFAILKYLKNPIVSLSQEVIDSEIKRIEQELGFEFTADQIQAINGGVKDNIHAISGKAGAGKTTILKAIDRILALDDSVPQRTACSLSGKAVRRIKEATGIHASTIHKMLEYKGTHFEKNANNPLTLNVIKIDEMSMIDNSLMHRIMAAMINNSKLVLIGDVQQLAPIGAGAVFMDLINSNTIPVSELTEVHRQAKKSGSLSLANKVRDGEQIHAKDDYERKQYGEKGDLRLLPFRKGESIVDAIVKIAQAVVEKNIDLFEFQVIVPFKNRGELSTKNLNLLLQDVFNPSKVGTSVNLDGIEVYRGDKVIKRGNCSRTGIDNGTLGTVISASEKSITIDFQDSESFVTYDERDEIATIELAYALTVHSNQGSEYKHVIFALDFSHYVLLSKQLVYVMMTRASESTMGLFEPAALHHAIATDHTVSRRTYLQELLNYFHNVLTPFKEEINVYLSENDEYDYYYDEEEEREIITYARNVMQESIQHYKREYLS